MGFMIRRIFSTTALAAALAAGAAVAAQEPATEAEHHHVNEAAPASSQPLVRPGEPIVELRGCLTEGHGDHHGPVLTQVQRSSISVAGITSHDASARVAPVAADEEAAAVRALVARDSTAPLSRAEFPLASPAVDLQPYYDQQVRLTGVVRDTNGQVTIYVVRVSPIGALCAGAH